MNAPKVSLRVLHCWEPSTDDERRGVCLLEDGHEGPHEFTLGDEIEITFSECQREDTTEGTKTRGSDA